jgi:cyclophilin family peptidyl-prolyl cis-trans isomerase
LQAALEDIKSDIASKRKNAAIEDTKKAKSILSNTGSVSAMKASCREPTICEQYIQSISTELDTPNLSLALKEFQDSSQGSDQERIALDKAYESQKKAVQILSKLEEQMIPAGYTTPVPDEYNDMIQLQGRATVVMTFKKATPSEPFLLDGKSYPEAKLTMIIDGYAAPVTAGNFIDLVQKKFYDGMDIQRSDGFVIQTGDPVGEATGYVGPGGKAVGNGPHGERQIPLEIYVKGDKGPFYESTIEDEMRGGQATVLPFSSYGAMGWAREEYEVNTGSSQFFWLLFDSDLTPAGKNVLDGRYPCFGYVVDGADFLSVIKEGDIIVSAKVTEGLEKLKPPIV